MKWSIRWRVCASLVVFLSSPGIATGQSRVVSEGLMTVLETIQPSALAGHVSFLSSDRLLGRAFGTAGELIAADYIASQFRSIGLEPSGEVGFLQTVRLVEGTPNADSWRLAFTDGERVLEFPAERTSPRLDPIHLDGVPVVKVVGDPLDPSAVSGLDIEGAAVITLREFKTNIRWLEGRRRLRTELSDIERLSLEREVDSLEQRMGEENALRLNFLAAIEEAGALVHLDGDMRDNISTWWDRASIWDPTDEWTGALGQGPFWRPALPNFRLSGEPVASLFDALPEGLTNWTIDLHLDAAEGEPIVSNNVIGLLPGTDPELSDTYVLVTAHYDGQGTWGGWEADTIMNSANDNATGVAAVVEVARAFTELPEPPRRSVLFVAFGGEEEGGLGSEFFINHPVVPLEKIAAVVNFEMFGRTDDLFEGSLVRRFSITGFNFSNMNEAFRDAGDHFGVDVRKHSNADANFSRSDNLSFARIGIPAHTLNATASYSDYHGNYDHWEKNDFENMAVLTKTAALGVWFLTNDDQVPEWNADDPQVERYLQAWLKLHGIGP